jgi:hypothetical protein
MTKLRKKKIVWTYLAALDIAKALAEQGPRVSAVLYNANKNEYRPVPGFVDGDMALPKDWEQIRLITPDGQVWKKDRDQKGTES